MTAKALEAEALDDGTDLVGALLTLAHEWKILLAVPLIAGLVALGAAYLLPVTYLSKTVFVPPQQQQSAAAAALS
ncbi:MAG: Wzz/FepE/Etk N-terminal domain-containing protein, partial [Variovorax sp.]